MQSPTTDEIIGRLAALETLLLGVACACLPAAFPEKRDLELAIGGISASIINNTGTRYGHVLVDKLSGLLTQMLVIASSPEEFEKLVQQEKEKSIG